MKKCNFEFEVSSELFLKLASKFSSFEGTILLFSGKDVSTAKTSFLSLFPIEAFSIGNHDYIQSSLKEKKYTFEKNPFLLLKEKLGKFSETYLPFPKWMGYLTYEMGGYSDKDVYFDQQKSALPLTYFQRAALTFVFDHSKKKICLYIDSETSLSEEEKKWFLILTNEQELGSLINELKSSLVDQVILAKSQLEKSIEEKQGYIEKIKKIQKMIRKGEVYQVNLSHEVFFSSNLDPFATFSRISEDNPTPFSAFIRLKEYSILSFSPERFLQKKGKFVQTIPIKGTIPRGKNEEEDQINREKLLNSEKEKAELLMVTDLLRNDLGKVCEIGSVVVQKLYCIEAYKNIYHLNSVINGKTLYPFDPIEILRQLFPGGSITGCPKLSAMKVIEELENRPRGIYTGSIGYFTNDGDFDFNIAIRTSLLQNEKQSMGLGGGIVIDSDGVKEYEETLYKGKNVFDSLGLDWEQLF